MTSLGRFDTSKSYKVSAMTQKKKVAKKSDAKSGVSSSETGGLSKAELLHMHDLMVRSRVLEDRLIQIYKLGEAYFWIGGPGEEAFGVPLGLLANKGQGLDHDYLHLHYRCTPTMVAMGMPMIDAVRLIMNKATDVSTGGRNFSGHYCYPQWNVVPVSSPIEVQYSMAIGTAWSQFRNKSRGITIVSGGDAGSAEAEFASCLIWSSRPQQELPILITVQNNKWGISTDYDSQHGEKYIADRGKAFGIRTRVLNCNDPIEAHVGLKEEFQYIRKTGKPSLVECYVSRLNGHSSATGGARVQDSADCVLEFEKKLGQLGYLKASDAKELWKKYDTEAKAAANEVRKEAAPVAESIWEHTYADGENADWRKF